MRKLTIKDHLLVNALFIPSPNCDERPKDTIVDLLVIHGISLPPAQFGGSEIVDFFTNCLDLNAHPYFSTIGHLRVSSHLLIRRDGQIIQFVPFNKRAWHAGISCFKGRDKCNDFSIGVELEGTDDIPYEQIQYFQLIEVASLLKKCYPEITHDRIVGHSDIAPERKTDPGIAFDWNYFRISLKGNS